MAMRIQALLAVASCAVVQRCACQDIGPMSPELWMKASANWNVTMTAYHQNLMGYVAKNGSCSSDLRQKMPACLQYEPAWCWATAVTQITSFYKPDWLPAKGNDCHGFECKIVGYKRTGDERSCCNGTKVCKDGESCCHTPIFGGVSCQDKCRGFAKKVDDGECEMDTCKHIGGSADDIVNAISNFAGKKYATKLDGPLSKQQLDDLLDKGHPVILGVLWSASGGHALTLAGCEDGAYYLHDSMNKEGHYQTLSYDQVAEYKPPWAPSLRGQWLETYWLDGDLALASDSIVV